MYGLIHTALRDMVIQDYGQEKWNKILGKSGVSQDAFLTMQSYEDSVAFSLVGSSAEVLDIKMETVLMQFGKYWLCEAAPKVYAQLLNVAGDTLFEFLENLDTMHDKITLTFLDYKPPSFKLERHSENHAFLHYKSTRQGLTPFVIGLIKGMEDRFNTSITIESIKSVEVTQGEHTIFEIRIT